MVLRDEMGEFVLEEGEEFGFEGGGVGGEVVGAGDEGSEGWVGAAEGYEGENGVVGVGAGDVGEN